MRKGLFVLAMIGASFAGGAVINGPGQEWTRNLLARAQRFIEPGPTVIPASSGDSSERSPADTPDDQIDAVPASPVPPLALTLEPLPRSREPAAAATEAAVATVATATAAAEAPAGLPPLSATPEPAAPPATAASPARGLGAVLSRAFLPRTTNPKEPKADAPSSASSPTPDSPPLDPALTRAGAETAATTSTPPLTDNRWEAIHRKMRDLGVRQFWIEGQPGGPSRFRCVIPVAGRTAVAQHFEAEGDDELRAAESALRRAALWKATELP